MTLHRPMFGVALFFILGIVFQEYCDLSFQGFCLGLIGFAVMSGMARRWKILSSFCVLLVFFCLGGIYLKSYQTLPKDHVRHVARYYRRSPVKVKGVVASDITQRESFYGRKTTFVLEVASLKTRWGWREKSGRVLVQAFRETDVQYGDAVRVEGKMHKPFDFGEGSPFSYPRYLSLRGIYYLVSVKKQGELSILDSGHGNPVISSALQLKNRLGRIFDQYLTPREAGIMQAILLGDRSQVPRTIRELFQQTGTAHILAISGLHVGIVTGLFFLIMRLLPLSLRFRYCLTILLLIGYGFMTGGRPSVVRATFMAVVLLGGYVFERDADGINSLSLAALLILLFNPLYVFDVGFQLSFVSVMSIFVFFSPLSSLLSRLFAEPCSPIAKYLISALAISFSAWMGVAGLVAYYFQIITPISIAANLFVIPLMTVVVALGFGLLLCGLGIPWLAQCFGVCVQLILNLMVVMSFIFSRFPFAYFSIMCVQKRHVFVYYGVLVAGGLILVILADRRKKLTKFENYDKVSFC